MAGLEAQFGELFPDTLTIEPFVSVDGYGKPSYGTGVDYVSRIESYNRMVRDSLGQERVASTVIYLMSVPDGLNEKSRITLPDGRQPRILKIDNLPDTADGYYAAIYT